MLSRKVHQSVLQLRSGRVDLAELTGFDLQGKTIGVIGAGHIGLHVIRIARGFGMRVLAFDVRRDPFLADLLGFRVCEHGPVAGRKRYRDAAFVRSLKRPTICSAASSSPG